MNFDQFRSENELFGWAVFEEFHRLGMENVFIAPGSRSTPLVLGADAQSQLTKFIHHDERGLGFAALGLAKASGKPVGIVTTSGTAVSNLLPALTEAFYSQVSLIVLSADRPFELRQTGANQAIDQVKLFQSVVMDHFDIPAPDSQTQYPNLFSVLSSAFKQSSRGPVHLNFMFREPLAPPFNGKLNRDFNFLQTWWDSKKAHESWETPPAQNIHVVPPPGIQDKKILFVAGGGLSESDQQSLKFLAAKLQVPILPDIVSGLRFDVDPHVLNFAEMIVEARLPKPERIYHFGGPLQSKRLNEYMRNQDCEKIWITACSKRLDFQHQKKLTIEMEPHDYCQYLSNSEEHPDPHFQSAWREIQILAGSFVNEHLTEELSEPAVARLLTQLAPANSLVYSGSSRPIRDFERFGSTGTFDFYSNRGTSGIDGNLATFFGLIEAKKQTALALIGDLAFLHDVSSLLLLKKLKTPSVMVVINNDGGGIFSFLPIAQHPNSFEKYFGTSHGLSVNQICEGFGIRCSLAKNLGSLRQDIQAGMRESRVTVIEVTTQRNHNFEFHQKIQKLWQERLRASNI